MSGFMCGQTGGGHWPDLGLEDPCCWESADQGPAWCSCWTQVFDLEQEDPQLGLDAGTRSAMCTDCAYRPKSPERSGDPNAKGNAELLDRLVEQGDPFWCHQGMRRPIHWRHPSGATFTPPGMALDYEPPIIGRQPFKADGTPADICGGWAALRLKAIARQTGGAA